MKKIEFIDLAYILGGKETIPSPECTAMQNEANQDSSFWNPDDWDKWADRYIDAGCTHADIYG